MIEDSDITSTALPTSSRSTGHKTPRISGRGKGSPQQGASEARGPNNEGGNSRGHSTGPDEEPDYFRIWSIAEMFFETGKLDKALLEWEASLSASVRGSKPAWEEGQSSMRTHTQGDCLILGAFHPAGPHMTVQLGYLQSFIMSQFYHAQIALFRMGLIFTHESYQDEIRKHPSPVLPSSFWARLGRASTICVEAARALITNNMELIEGSAPTRHDEHTESKPSPSFNDKLPPPPLLSGTPGKLMTAACVLALSVMREPKRRLARADAERVSEAATFAEECYERWGQDPTFSQRATTSGSEATGRYSSVIDLLNTPSGTLPGLHPTGNGQSSTISPGNAAAIIYQQAQAAGGNGQQQLYPGKQVDEEIGLMDGLDMSSMFHTPGGVHEGDDPFGVDGAMSLPAWGCTELDLDNFWVPTDSAMNQ
ncbi:hypothetical protein Micbo1qcDRAFT_174466 [Microdochium bolleyi]|uniref:Transcription factor domain-containing protein n=1 Tax=Microdochium bolleyi TaxID=196109 RepID=A0A136J898_9PEZI|nr:hypothetical protein Micbo1qcDRAFT_174466 [Microdochium bolleyi]